MGAGGIGDERRLGVLGRDREARVVLGQVDLREEPVGDLDGGDAGERELLGQAVLQGAERALRTPPRLGRVGRDVLDPELRERPADLGELILGDLLPCLGRQKIVARAIGIEGARQAMRGDHRGERVEAAHGAFLVDQERRIDRGGGIIQRDDQVELLLERRQPAMARAVLMQEHAGQRPPRALLAVRPAALCLRDQAGRLQPELGPGVAAREAMVLAQLVVEVLGGEPAVALAVQAQHLLQLVDRHLFGRGLAEPSIQQAARTLVFVPVPPAAEGPLAHAQDLGGRGLAQPALLPAAVDVLELHPSQSLQHLRPPHPPLPAWRANPTGQIVCYEDRPYRVSATQR